MRIDFGAKTWMVPMPVLIIGTYDENGVPDAMNAAWGGIYDYNKIGICISASHKTTKNILRQKDFTVAFADRKHITQADYVGIVSGNDTPDKIEKAGLTCEKAKNVNAPVFNEFPMALECRVLSYDAVSGYMTGEILNVSVDENAITDGKIDIKKLDPVVFETFNNKYMTLGDVIADAFEEGNKRKD